METVKYGIIGVGNMGSGHLKMFMNGDVENAEVVAVADINDKKLQKVKENYPNAKLDYYKSGEELIRNADVDAVIVAVPHYFHPPLVIQALQKGISAICEKPAGVYTKQVKEMNAVADQSSALFTVMFNQRTNCLYRKMREIILSGGIGQVKRVNWIITDWYRTQAYYDSGDWRATWDGEGGGVLFNQCPHQLDLLQWVVGMSPKRVEAHCHFGKWHDIEVEDDVTAYLEYDNGATGVFITSTGDAPGTNRFEVLGSLGKIVCENNALTYVKNKTDEREFCFSSKEGFAQPATEVIHVETDGKNPQHVGILRNFTNTLLGKEELFVKGQEGLLGVELMDAMLLSQWLGRAVELPIDDELYLSELNKRRANSRKKQIKEECVVDLSNTYGSEKR
jgi:predicted dehydrogenase